MKLLVVLGFCCLHAALGQALAEQGAAPVTQSAAAEVTIDPVPAGQRLIRLPGIEFPLRVTPACAAGQEFASLSISIADTRRIFSATDFETEPVLETSLRVPGRQISPIAIDEFCVAAGSSSPTTVSITDAFTAHIAMRCNSESQQLVNYDTLALEILLICRLPDETAAAGLPTATEQPGNEDQDASSMTRF